MTLCPTGPSRWRRRRRDAAVLVARRTAIAVPVVIVVSLGVFLLSAFSPFDPLIAFLGDRVQNVSLEERRQMAESLGLNKSWWESWLIWVDALAHGDLGHSRVYRQPVADVFAERLPWTVLLSGVGIVAGLAISVVLGVRAGLRPGSWSDRIATTFAVLLGALPSYVVSLGAIMVFSLGLGLFPTGGLSRPGDPITAAGVALHLTLPAIVLGLSLVPWLLLSVRSSVHEAIRSEAVAGAVARGIPPRTVVRAHVLPVSLAPVVTLLGTRLPELVVGAVIVEEIFAWPGLAQATVSSAQQLDFALLSALTIATTLLVLLGSLLADAIYLFLDPRVTP
ncbi:ABC transporter permease [Austwickia chelonae]|uniref:ABC transporter permease n=1 Tax=Austwickia chelonae TaxID=100225 RepID=UPI000E27A634|nr:ABC transporter permease [Austwickia chelonae]